MTHFCWIGCIHGVCRWHQWKSRYVQTAGSPSVYKQQRVMPLTAACIQCRQSKLWSAWINARPRSAVSSLGNIHFSACYSMSVMILNLIWVYVYQLSHTRECVLFDLVRPKLPEAIGIFVFGRDSKRIYRGARARSPRKVHTHFLKRVDA